MTLWNSNRLRLSAYLVSRDEGPARRLVQVSSYKSNDHGRGTEHNYSLWLWSLSLGLKYRPNGKHA